MQLLLLLIIVAAIVIFYKFPHILPENWRVRSGQDLNNHMFRLQEGEQIMHQSIGISDANSHLSDEEVKKKNKSLEWVGQELTHDGIIHLALTSRNRLILSYDPRCEPVAFEKGQLPLVKDSGRTAKRMSKVALKFIKNFPKNSGQTRIIEMDSPLIPEIMIHGNTGRFEMSVPVEFIPTLLSWVKKNQ